MTYQVESVWLWCRYEWFRGLSKNEILVWLYLMETFDTIDYIPLSFNKGEGIGKELHLSDEEVETILRKFEKDEKIVIKDNKMFVSQSMLTQLEENFSIG